VARTQCSIACLHSARDFGQHVEMEWDDVRLFLAVLRGRNLGAAAAELGVDRSTASRRLVALETSLGATLFLRTRDGLRPSRVADRLLPHAERMELEARALASAAIAGERDVVGTVRVATTEGLAAMLVRQGLLRVRDAHPGLVVELLGGNRPVDLARGEADLALRLRPVREAALRVRRVGKLALAVFASPAYVHARGRPRNAEELAGHDVIVPGGELASLPEARWLSSRPDVRVVFRSSSMPAMAEAVVAGHGVAVLTRAWGESIAGTELLFAADAIAPRPLWLVSASGGTSSAVRVVAAKIAEIVGRVAA
jgi:DNA-binding transcriptional LysR family regulator